MPRKNARNKTADRPDVTPADSADSSAPASGSNEVGMEPTPPVEPENSAAPAPRKVKPEGGENTRNKTADRPGVTPADSADSSAPASGSNEAGMEPTPPVEPEKPAAPAPRKAKPKGDDKKAGSEGSERDRHSDEPRAKRKFFTLFDVRLTHSYYADGRCPDFVVEPVPDTQRLLERYRCMSRNDEDGIRVLARLDERGRSLLPMGWDVSFVFSMRLRNPGFELFTDLSGMAENDAPLYTNTTPGLARGRQLSLVSGSGEGGKSLAASRPVGGDVFANIEIRIAINNQSLTRTAENDAPASFEIGFEPKRVHWTYYCVADPGRVGDGPRIVDMEKSARPVVFGDGNRTNLGEDPDPTDRVASLLAGKYPGMRRFRFVSDRPIPCQQATGGRLQLYLDGVRPAGNLPNPSFRNYTTTAVREDGTLRQQDSLFQIVKYLTCPFSTTGV
uniref:Uncharacterized protein n=1 Tax=Candidatus Kentrum sp. DK TaxID=2126562 RepID=A0A450RVB7_9GAMM|nr:MAG: hypothetical protein BECKDK2373B_GA0170837_100411 [Candidatus Kentron sp. DK]